MAYDALGHVAALWDDDRALQLSPRLAVAALNHGMLHYREGHYPEAMADQPAALDKGADPAMVYHNLELVQLAREDRRVAETSLRRVLQHSVAHAVARELFAHLQDGP